jgi:hypothetical protein
MQLPLALAIVAKKIVGEEIGIEKKVSLFS